MKRDYAERYLDNLIVKALLQEMRTAREFGRPFEACLKEARHQFNREVREAADATPLDQDPAQAVGRK